MGAEARRQGQLRLGTSQQAVADHRRGPLLVLGGAGGGRSEALAARIAALHRDGTGPERVLVLTAGDATANSIRARAAELIEGPYEELSVFAYERFAERLLRELSVEAGLDPFFTTVTSADRLAMLLARVDELPLRRHEIRGNPAGLLARLIERIDVLKEEGIGPGRLRELSSEQQRSASSAAERERALRERDFAELYERHDELLRADSSLDRGDLILTLSAVLADRPDTAERVHERYTHLIADELEDAGAARLQLIAAVAPPSGPVVAWDGRQATRRFRVAAEASLGWFRTSYPGAAEITLEANYRAGGPLARVAAVLAAAAGAGPVPEPADEGEPGHGQVEFWRCANERAQAQAVAREVESLLAAGETTPERICVLTRPGGREGRLVAAALEERSIRFGTPGAAALFRRPEVRDVLAWLRILADPGDAAAAVRALTRPPIQVRSSDLALCTSIARRRKLDMVAAVEAAIESPQLPPESRDRLRAFLKLYRAAAARLEDLRPEVFIRRLIERVGVRRQNLFAASPETAERLASLSRLSDFAAAWTRRRPSGSCREFIAYLAAVAEAGERFDSRSVATTPGSVLLADPAQVKGLEFDTVYLVGLHGAALRGHSGQDLWIPDELLDPEIPRAGEELDSLRRARLAYAAVTRASQRLVLAWPETLAGAEQRRSLVYELAHEALGTPEAEQSEELFGPAESLHSTYRLLRDEVLESSWRAGAALSEMRLDTAEDVNAAVVRFLELLKMAALIQRPGAEGAADAIAALNDLLGRVATPEQKAALEASALDDYVLSEERGREQRREAMRAQAEPSLEPFLPRRGDGLALSASDIDLYLTCPLKYKFARVFAIPQEPTINMRFGILLHNVLERFHTEELRTGETPSLEELLGLFEAGWRRSGFGSSDDELQYRDRAVAALARYHERNLAAVSQPVWLERSFNFQIGEHQLRGRIDRIDRLPDGGYELIDYKTGAPKAAEELAEDVQLALYRIAAREAWEIEDTIGAYWYVLEDSKVPVAGSPDDLERVERTVISVGEGIGGQDFEPRPDFNVCSWCDYRLICPASEA